MRAPVPAVPRRPLALRPGPVLCPRSSHFSARAMAPAAVRPEALYLTMNIQEIMEALSQRHTELHGGVSSACATFRLCARWAGRLCARWGPDKGPAPWLAAVLALGLSCAVWIARRPGWWLHPQAPLPPYRTPLPPACTPPPKLQLAPDAHKLNVSHEIHGFHFGPPYPGQTNPLEGIRRIDRKANGIDKYFVKVVRGRD